jgi:class 3 adenylate cyclase/tetratricopeptide (TPR) repeat protein
VPVCNKCGKANPEHASFCSSCGAPLQAEEAGPPEVRKTVTVLFSDLAGSTSIGESLDPEPLRRVLTRYYAEMKQVLERHGGTVRELVGDAMLAVFGAPVAHEDDALRAVKAASAMSERLAELNDELERDWSIRLTSRTGINTGEVVVESPETERPLVLGDAINVAARFQSAAEPGQILLGDDTYRLVRDAVRAEAVEPLALKGKSETVPAWCLLGVTDEPGLARRLDAPIVGRERELDLLRQAFERTVSAPACELVTVLGPAGVGKSRLTSEFVAGFGEQATVLRARCLAYGEGITFWPVAEIVRKAAAIDEADPPDAAREKIAALLGDSEEAASVADGVAAAIGLAESAAELQEIFWAIRKLLEGLAREHPLVCIFDDVHWAEPAFLDLVESIAGRASGAPLLLLCLARPELPEERQSWMSGAIVLEPLGEHESARLIQSLLGVGGPADELAARVGEAAEGNPLFVEELLRMLVDDGFLERSNGGWQAIRDLSELALPPSINALLAARLDRLTASERGVIQRASVIGKVFWWGAVAELSPEAARAEVGSHLQALVRKELIRPDPATFAGEEGFRFGHILVRDAAYQSIPKAARAELHERFAGWLEGRAGERAGEYEEIVGYHLEQAVRYESELGPADERRAELAARAGARLASAGLRARGRGDMSAVANLLSRAAALLPAQPDLKIKLADALVETGELARAEGILAEAAGAGESPIELLAGLELAFIELVSSPEAKHADIVEQARRAIPVFEAAGDDAALARAWRLISFVDGLACHWGARAGALERALVHAERAGDKRQEAAILGALGQSLYFGSTPAAEGIRRCEELLRRAGGLPRVEASVLLSLAGLQGMQGRFDEARQNYRRGNAIENELGYKLRAAGGAMMRASIELYAGDLDAAEKELRWAFETLDAMGEKGFLSTVAAMLARLNYARERYEEAERLAGISKEATAADDLISQVLWRAALAKVLARRGDVGEAERLAREAVDLMAETDELDRQGDTLLDLAEVLRMGGKDEDAAPVVAEALRLYEQKENLPSAERARALLEHPSQEAAPR